MKVLPGGTWTMNNTETWEMNMSRGPRRWQLSWAAKEVPIQYRDRAIQWQRLGSMVLCIGRGRFHFFFFLVCRSGEKEEKFVLCWWYFSGGRRDKFCGREKTKANWEKKKCSKVLKGYQNRCNTCQSREMLSFSKQCLVKEKADEFTEQSLLWKKGNSKSLSRKNWLDSWRVKFAFPNYTKVTCGGKWVEKISNRTGLFGGEAASLRVSPSEPIPKEQLAVLHA